jgi:hypothetical protein
MAKMNMIEMGKRLEQIHYDLDCQTVFSPKLMGNIIKALLRIQDYDSEQEEENYDSVIERILFYEGDSGATMPVKQIKESKKKYIVLLKPNSRDNAIAHEIAHALLDHRMYLQLDTGNIQNDKQEKEANDLIKKWGFRRLVTKEDR